MVTVSLGVGDLEQACLLDSGSKSGLLPTMPITGEAAGSQHGSSSSSGMNLEKCGNCEDEPISDAVFFCGKCEHYLCTSCDVDLHKPKSHRLHERISIVDRRKELEVLEIHNQMRDNPPITTKKVEEDAKNKFCFFCPTERRIFILPRLAALVKDPMARPSLVSFVGPTGVGKSFLLKYIFLVEGVKEDRGMPVIGASTDSTSTSADIHIYPDPGRQDSAEPLLYLDCEGRGGSKKPHALTTFLHHGGKRSAYESYVGNRYAHVQTSYPRMMYIFSDVLCFVFSGSWREKSSVLEPLLEWGKTASRGADNQHRPKLIIIFNKSDGATSGDKFDDFEGTFRWWIKGVDEQQQQRLELYFDVNPLVVCVPHADIDETGMKFYSRVEKLRDAIAKSIQRIRSDRSGMRLLFTRHQLEFYMRKVAGVFSKEPNGVFDIYKAMIADNAIVGLTGYIVQFRREVENASPCDWTSSQKFVTSLRVLNSHVKQSMLLWISRNVEFTYIPQAKLPPDLRKALKDAEGIIDNEMPCGATLYFTCGTLKGQHKDHHSGVSFSMIGNSGARQRGKFRPYPEVSAAMKDYGSLVKVAENVFTEVQGVQGVRDIREKVLSYRRSARKGYSWLGTSYKVCVICLLNLPTEMLSCGHIICDKCAKEEAIDRSAKEEAKTSPQAQLPLAKSFSMLCPVCQSPVDWYPTNLPPLAGCRILSLDGGGVRGIVELLSLRAIMDYFPNMHVEDLFDIVVGTSTGGIIALALTVRKPREEPKRLPCVIDLFKDLAKEVFSIEQRRSLAKIPFVGEFLAIFWYESKYKNDALLRLLKQHLGEQSLMRSCVGGPRVIITACDYDKNAAAAWFTSYSRPSSDADEAGNDLLQKAALREDITKSSSNTVDGRVCDGYLFNAMQVAAATSAAPTFLPLFSTDNRRWVDGGLRNNGPPTIAIDEAKKLWPESKVSALISLGCGKFDESSDETMHSVLKTLKLVVHIATEAEEKCKSAINSLKELQPDYASTSGPGIRLNPTIEPCGLDDAAKMGLLIEQTEEYLSTDGKVVVGKAANLLFAALFYLHIGSNVDLQADNLENLRIRSRSALPPHLQDALKNSSENFSVTVETRGTPPTGKFRWNECTWKQGYMDLPFDVSDVPTTRPLSVVVKLHMRLPGTEAGEKYFPIPISGMPYILKV